MVTVAKVRIGSDKEIVITQICLPTLPSCAQYDLKILKNTDSLIFTCHFNIYCSIKHNSIIRNTSSFLSYFTVFVFPHPFCPEQ